MDSSEQISLSEPPESLFTPRDDERVLAVIDDPSQVTAAIQDLVREGYSQENIVVLCGAEGAARLEASDRRRGLLGGLYRFAERVLGEEPEERERYARELAAGRFLIAVPADESRKSHVAELLARHGAHDMEHFGRYYGEPLGSEGDIVSGDEVRAPDSPNAPS
jgi:hypothetical protein